MSGVSAAERKSKWQIVITLIGRRGQRRGDDSLLAGITAGRLPIGGISGKPPAIGGYTPAIVDDVMAAMARAAFAARLCERESAWCE